jgi:hypothetical protein
LGGIHPVNPAPTVLSQRLCFLLILMIPSL